MRSVLAGVILLLLLPGLALGGCPPEPAPDQGTYRVLARAYKLLGSGRNTQAAAILKKLTNSGSVHHQVWFLLGVAAYRAGAYPEAVAYFHRAIKAYRCFKDAWVNLGVALYATGKYGQAARALIQAFSLSRPPDYALVYQAGVMLLAGGKPAQALEVFSRLINLPKPRWRWLAAAARAHMELKRWRQAEKLLVRALGIAPLEATLWRMLAGAYAGAGAYLKAAVALEVASWIRPPSSPSQWRQLAQVWAGAGVPGRAAWYYRKGMDHPPTPGQLTHLARLLVMAGRLEEASRTLASAISSHPSARRWAMLGRVKMMMGRWKEAAEAFEEAARLAKGRKKGRYLVSAGWCWWNGGELARAATTLKSAAAAAPRSREARSARALLAQLSAYQKLLEGH